jgi:hypothetical protein
MVAMTFLLARRRTLLVATPLALAVAALLATNVLLFQKFTLSPHGAVFAVARFSGDGLVENILAKNCPQSGWHLCDWQGRLPTDSDEFLWNPKGPVESYPHAPIAPMAMAPEAQKILAATIRQEPFGVLSAMAGNTLTQLHRVALGDVLTAAAAGQSMDATIRKFLGPAEQSRYDASRQAQDRLLWIAERLNRISLPVQILGVLATLWTIWRGPRLARNMALLILAGLLANAFATGALSGPHDRYQARIAWLILLPLLMRPERVLPESAAG